MNTLDWLGSIFLAIPGAKNPVDVTPAVVKIEITEDLFSPYIMGEIILQDMPSINLITYFGEDGLVGKGEQIEFSFTTKIGYLFKEIKNLFIYAVQPMVPDDPHTPKQQMVYKINFASQIFFTNELIILNRYYEGKLSEIVKEICEKNLQLKLSTLEDTNKKQGIYIPRLSPIQAISMISSRCVSKENTNAANYIFYGDLDNKFHFVSLNKLLAADPVIGTYDFDGITVTTSFGENYMIDGRINEGPTKHFALRYKVKPFIPIQNMIQGMYASSLIEFDITKRKYKKNEYIYHDEFDKINHLAKYPIVSKGTDFISLNSMTPDTNRNYAVTSQWVISEKETSSSPSYSSNSVNEYFLKRKSQMQQINQMGLELEMPGNVQLNIGKSVFFGRPQIETASHNAETWKRNPYVAGKFLVTRRTTILENSISNNTTGFNLKTVLSLRKDSDSGTSL